MASKIVSVIFFMFACSFRSTLCVLDVEAKAAVGKGEGGVGGVEGAQSKSGAVDMTEGVHLGDVLNGFNEASKNGDFEAGGLVKDSVALARSMLGEALNCLDGQSCTSSDQAMLLRRWLGVTPQTPYRGNFIGRTTNAGQGSTWLAMARTLIYEVHVILGSALITHGTQDPVQNDCLVDATPWAYVKRASNNATGHDGMDGDKYHIYLCSSAFVYNRGANLVPDGSVPYQVATLLIHEAFHQSTKEGADYSTMIMDKCGPEKFALSCAKCQPSLAQSSGFSYQHLVTDLYEHSVRRKGQQDAETNEIQAVINEAVNEENRRVQRCPAGLLRPGAQFQEEAQAKEALTQAFMNAGGQSPFPGWNTIWDARVAELEMEFQMRDHWKNSSPDWITCSEFSARLDFAMEAMNKERTAILSVKGLLGSMVAKYPDGTVGPVDDKGPLPPQVAQSQVNTNLEPLKAQTKAALRGSDWECATKKQPVFQPAFQHVQQPMQQPMRPPGNNIALLNNPMSFVPMQGPPAGRPQGHFTFQRPSASVQVAIQRPITQTVIYQRPMFVQRPMQVIQRWG